MENKPYPVLVSISCITYNHSAYIREAIDGFLMQKTNFKFEVLIHDDASTDGTSDIIREYEKKYPDIIKPIYQTENQYSKGDGTVGRIQRNRAKGKYYALCEGDDYWTDPCKLQKQVDFLEANPEYVFTFHDCETLEQNTGIKHLRVGNRKIDEVVDLESVIVQNNIPTASIIYRNIIDWTSIPKMFSTMRKGDYVLVVLLAEKGLGKYLPGAMSVYRIHEGGVWSGANQEYRNDEDVKFYIYLNEYFSDRKVRNAIKAKLNFCKTNIALAKIRKGNFISGIFIYIMHMNLIGNKKLRTKLIKIPGAFKSGLLNLFHNSN